MNYTPKNCMYIASLIICFAAQHSYGSESKPTNPNSPKTTWLQNKWNDIKKDHQEHYANIGNAHAQAGKLRNTMVIVDKKS